MTDIFKSNDISNTKYKYHTVKSIIPDSDTMNELLDSYGDDGWDCVSILPNFDQDHYLFVFRRLKSITIKLTGKQYPPVDVNFNKEVQEHQYNDLKTFQAVELLQNNEKYLHIIKEIWIDYPKLSFGDLMSNICYVALGHTSLEYLDYKSLLKAQKHILKNGFKL
jgi:hypothetical protein